MGAFTNCNNTGYAQSTAIGYGAQITASNQIVLGTATETVSIPGKIGTNGSTFKSVRTFNAGLTVSGTATFNTTIGGTVYSTWRTTVNYGVTYPSTSTLIVSCTPSKYFASGLTTDTFIVNVDTITTSSCTVQATRVDAIGGSGLTLTGNFIIYEI